MSDGRWSDVERACRDLVAGNAGRLRWAWDARFNAALATFTAAEAPEILASLAVSLPSRWDHATVGRAPASVAKLADGIGGVRAGQFVLSTDPGQDVLVVGAWWPWGGGLTVSVRLFPLASGAAAASQEDLAMAFRGWFCP